MVIILMKMSRATPDLVPEEVQQMVVLMSNQKMMTIFCHLFIIFESDAHSILFIL